MRILNPNNLPQALVNAASPEEGHTYDKDRYSITDLIGSPWQRHLKMKHSGEVEVDVEDMTWLLMGKAFHLLMEKHSPKDAVAEHKIVINYKDVTLVGIPDLYHNGTLYDYKVTSVYSFLLGEKIEWEQQLNCYVWMLKSIGIDINKIQIIATLKDHMTRKAAEEGYPNKPLIAVDIPLWSLEDTETYINKRIEAHKLLEPCSPEERWSKKDSFAVKKQGAKRAMRVLDSKESAERWIASNNSKNEKLIIEKRQGEDYKCLRYCNYSKWCQYNRYLGVETNE